jgi:hypothetical protein
LARGGSADQQAVQRPSGVHDARRQNMLRVDVGIRADPNVLPATYAPPDMSVAMHGTSCRFAPVQIGRFVVGLDGQSAEAEPGRSATSNAAATRDGEAMRGAPRAAAAPGPRPSN